METPPKWYKFVAIIALVWNLLGCLAVFADIMIRPEDIAKMSANQQAMYAARTTWSTAASLLAVLGGAAGSLGLFLRKRWSMPLLAASVVGLIVQDYGLFVVANGINLGGTTPLVIQGFVILISLGLVYLARTARTKGWIA